MKLKIENEIKNKVNLIKDFYKVKNIQQKYFEKAKLIYDKFEKEVKCIKCLHPNCIYYDEEIKIKEKWVEDFLCDNYNKVCPVNAIEIDKTTDYPKINKEKCILCGLCAVRCPIGAIYFFNNQMIISKNESEFFKEVIFLPIMLVKYQEQMKQINALKLRHNFILEDEKILKLIYDKVESLNEKEFKILIRNLLISLGNKSILTKIGVVYNRMDGFFMNSQIKGVIEIEKGKDTLEAVRRILEDISYLDYKNNIEVNQNVPLVVCFKLPNKRQGYYQVIKDIKKVLKLEVQTVSLGMLLILSWNNININFIEDKVYLDFDNLSVRDIIEKNLGRKINISQGYLGITEPSK